MANTKPKINTARLELQMPQFMRDALDEYVATHPIYRSASEAVRGMVEKELGND